MIIIQHNRERAIMQTIPAQEVSRTKSGVRNLTSPTKAITHHQGEFRIILLLALDPIEEGKSLNIIITELAGIEIIISIMIIREMTETTNQSKYLGLQINSLLRNSIGCLKILNNLDA
jgi:hypothetical protein